MPVNFNVVLLWHARICRSVRAKHKPLAFFCLFRTLRSRMLTISFATASDVLTQDLILEEKFLMLKFLMSGVLATV